MAVVVQPITGLLLARQTGLPLTEGWLIASLALYVVAGLFWVPVIFFQIRMRNLAGLAFTQGEPLPEERNRRTGIRFPGNNSASSTN